MVFSISCTAALVFYAVLALATAAVVYGTRGGGLAAVFGGVALGSAGALGYLAFTYWFSTKAQFAYPLMARDEKLGVFGSLARSFALVRGQFWRVLGLTLLFGIICSFAVGAITGPLIAVLILPAYLGLLQELLHRTGGYADVLPKLFGPLALGLGVSMYLQAALMGVLGPTFQALLALDLTARAGRRPARKPKNGR
mgnify:CR=1 FL=1